MFLSPSLSLPSPLKLISMSSGEDTKSIDKINSYHNIQKVNMQKSIHFYMPIINRRISNFLRDNKNSEVSRNKSYKKVV